MNSKKILLVDDDPVIRKALSTHIKASGFEVLTAVDGSGAIAAVRKEKPDLILLDITFPPNPEGGLANGMQVMAWLKRIEESAKTPVIVITGSDPARYEKDVLAAGAACFVHKSVDPKEIIAIIRRTLGDKPASA